MLYIGIDGGGTKTKMTLFNESGDILNEVVMPSVHVLTKSKEECIKILKEGLNILDKNCEAKVVAGLAGYGNQKEMRQQIEYICEQSFGKRSYQIYSDIQIAMTGALNSQDGIVVIAGTGSIAFSTIGGKTSRCGGWGYELGDEGSAYWIAKKMLSIYCQQVDGRLEKTLLYDLVKEECCLENEYDLITFMNDLHHDRTKIANLAKINGMAAKRNDPYACQIYKDAAHEIFILIKTLAKDFKTPFHVSYIGGVFTNADDLILKPLSQYLQSIPCQLISPIHTPEYGAYILAKNI